MKDDNKTEINWDLLLNEERTEALRELPESETGTNWELLQKIREAKNKDKAPPLPGEGDWMVKTQVIEKRPQFEKQIRGLFPEDYYLRTSAVRTLIGVADFRQLECEVVTHHTDIKFLRQ